MRSFADLTTSELGLARQSPGDYWQSHFFDAFDALAIAFVLPVLVPLWKLTAP